MNDDVTSRFIARLDIKGPNLIKGVHLEGLRVIGSPHEYAIKYYQEGIDELLFMDCVASLYGRNSLIDVIAGVARDIFVPMTVGGGIRSVEDARKILRAGADKIAINTAALANPRLIQELSRQFGSQCVVLSIEAKAQGNEKWEAYSDNGRERSGRDVVDWAREGSELGAGEILLTSIDREGTRKGFDEQLIQAVNSVITVPLVVSGGMGCPDHAVRAFGVCGADAIAMADVLHYGRFTLRQIRETVANAGVKTRNVG